MFIIYLLLVVMGLIIANFVVTYTLYSAVDRDMRDKLDKERMSRSDMRVNLYEELHQLKGRLETVEARCKHIVGKGKKKRVPEVKDENKK